ncbi:GAF domain-containing protein [Variovorax ginsengisoli]|uniref:GAF domain-containing protein n=1 Tax=Variovorax ginsengisoli TaxID=363844 RepID=A0ABT8S341_9BURK|nr:GAF domain-containing protein [Variovorax ginsengisoli]MDN8614088.1 GAF domain-containing protein [Variovorax ginsengisoli]MDO1533258.1 GAF domain-containing protein [Variovorax ginsengisoli]
MKTILDTSPDPADDGATRLTAVTADADLRASGLIEVSIGSLLRVVREQLKLEVVFIGEFVDGSRVFRHIASRTEDAVIKQGEGHPLDETICQRIVDGRMPCLTPDVASVRSDYGLPLYYEALGAHIGVPVRLSDGTLYGMLCGFSFAACPHLDQRDVRRLEMAAHATARLIAQAEGRDFEPLAFAH